MFKWGNDKYSHLGYKLFTFIFCKRFDCYLFYYKEGSYIPRHKDPSFGMRHYRLNFVLKDADVGGQFVCQKMIWSYKNRIFLFRADNSYHKIEKIEKGNRILLSFGIRIKGA